MSDVTAWVILLDPTLRSQDVQQISGAIGSPQPGAGFTQGDEWAAIAFADGRGNDELDRLRRLPGVNGVVPVAAPYRLASREVFGRSMPVRLGPNPDRAGSSRLAGGDAPVLVMARLEGMLRSSSDPEGVAHQLADAGATIVGAGTIGVGTAFDEPGALSIEDLGRIRDAAALAGMGVSVELTDARQIEVLAPLADVLEVAGAKMQDFNLLRDLGRARSPVLLRRGPGSTVEEFLLAAEYVLTHGNGRVLLCESGIRSFGSPDATRFEINSIPVMKRATHLPVVADVSKAAAGAGMAITLARAAIAAGADGVVLDLTGPRSSLETRVLTRFDELRAVAAAVGRRL